MPNWTYNTVRMKNIGNENLYDDEGNFDFNKLIPMPEGLDKTISGGDIMECVAYYLLKTNTKAIFWKLMEKYKIHVYSELKKTDTKSELEAKLIRRIYPDTLRMYNDELYDNNVSKHTPMEVGEHYLNLYKKCGYWDWYGWSNANWGTKWNACETNKGDDTVCFDTAWCEPEPIWIALSKAFPEREITITANYEDGLVTDSVYLNGELTSYREEYETGEEEYETDEEEA